MFQWTLSLHTGRADVVLCISLVTDPCCDRSVDTLIDDDDEDGLAQLKTEGVECRDLKGIMQGSGSALCLSPQSFFQKHFFMLAISYCSCWSFCRCLLSGWGGLPMYTSCPISYLMRYTCLSVGSQYCHIIMAMDIQSLDVQLSKMATIYHSSETAVALPGWPFQVDTARPLHIRLLQDPSGHDW